MSNPYNITDIDNIIAPYAADCSRLHVFGSTEADCIKNHVNADSPMVKVGTPTINSNHFVATKGSGFIADAASKVHGGTKIIIATRTRNLSTGGDAYNVHWIDQNFIWCRQSGANALFRGDGGATADTDVSSGYVSGEVYGWRALVDRPFMMALSIEVGDQRLTIEEGNRFRYYSKAPVSLNARADTVVKLGGYSTGEAEGHNVYAYLEYPERNLTRPELNEILINFTQPLVEYRGGIKGVGAKF